MYESGEPSYLSYCAIAPIAEQLPSPFSRVRVRRDLRRRAEPLEDLLERRALLLLREARIDLRDGLLESVHPEDELFALGQELRMLFARHERDSRAHAARHP